MDFASTDCKMDNHDFTNTDFVTLDRNPHCAQLKKCPDYDIGVGKFAELLEDDANRREYFTRKYEKTVNHWGQRKLLMSEIQFFTEYSRDGDIVVYAGAAPGTHIKKLSQLFPQLKFVLVDPADFTVKENDKIKICQTYFTDEFAGQFSGRENILFISDIRSVDPHRYPEHIVNEKIMEDMMNQMRWHQIIKPRYSLLKFRFPWNDNSTLYLDGKNYLQVWGPQTTTETRLVVERDAKLKLYSHREIEQKMFYFNTTTRVARYEHDAICPEEGNDYCYDCAAEVNILKNYLRKFHPENCDSAAVKKMIQEISRSIDPRRKLGDPTPEKEKRYKRISNRQHIEGLPAYEQPIEKIREHTQKKNFGHNYSHGRYCSKKY